MRPPTKLQALVTGELAGTWCVLINAHVHPQHPRKREILPHGYNTEVRWSDGSVTEGVLKPVPIWYIETPDARVVVDTGFGDPEEVTRIRLAQGFPSMMRTRPEWHVPAALGQVGCRPEDVDAVIISHCHYDHVGGNELFTRARFYIRKNEIPLALAPPPWAAHYLPECARHLTGVRERLSVLDDEQEIVPGVRAWRAGGHTPGSVVVTVDSDRGPVAIMGDVMHDYVNLDRWWPGTSNNYWNIDDLVRAYHRVREEARIVLPGHDWRLWDVHPGGRVI
jgi:glyoxylase-like metal-dependent hydrolase (beta-lactamase superfamily II)